MPALDDDYYQYRPTLEDLARAEEERRRREQDRYAPPGAPAPMAPSEYVVAQAPIPPSLRANELPVGPDPRASATSALDLQEPRAPLDTLARQGMRPPERYAPPGAPAPMYPTPPAPYGPIPTGDVATAAIPLGPTDQQVPPPMPLGTPGVRPGVSPATSAILSADREGPAEAALPPPGPLGMPGRQPGVSQATQDILAADREIPGDLTFTLEKGLHRKGSVVGQAERGTPISEGTPAKEGDFIWTAARGLHRAKGGETDGFNLSNIDLGDITFSAGKGLHRRGSTVGAEVTSSTPETATTPKPVATADIPPVTPAGTAVAATKPPEVKPYVTKGAVGRPRSATGAPEEPPNATVKASIDPNYLVRLEKSNPALHDAIVQAATTAGIGSWDYANLIYAASKGDPNHNENGRKGIAGLTDGDIQQFKSGGYGRVFADADPMNPATSLMMGALKYRQVRDEFGPKTPASIAAYYLGIDRVNYLAGLSPSEQREHIPDAVKTQIRESINPDAKPGSAPDSWRITDNGTYTAKAGAEAMTRAAQAGDPRIYYRYQNDSLPRGMTSNDGWRYAENKMVEGFIRAGDMDGAMKARELMFQMSHIGANQALMRAHGLMQAGDNVGAAKELALAYWATPDGGQARFHVGPQGIVGQRYNEATGQPVGPPMPMTPDRVMALMNVTKDPMAYQKNVRESQKHNADLEHKQAETGKLRAETVDIPARRATAEAEVDRRTFNDVLRSYRPAAGAGSAASKDPAISHQIEQEAKDYYELKDITGKILQDETGARQAQMNMFKDMRFNMPRLASDTARAIAKDLHENPRGGAYKVVSGTGGVGWVVPRNSNQPVAYLSPGIARLFIAPATPPPASPIGATPAPAR